MSDADRGQVTDRAAEVYDSFFVPALFAQWTEAVLDAAHVGQGDAVVDVGCGTGVLARAAHDRVRPVGRVVGVDPNDGMLAVATANQPAVDWKSGFAEELPFPAHSFDRAISQFALMFFSDQRRACEEIARVTRPSGRVAIAVWDSLDSNAGYARLAALLERLFGPDEAHALRAPFALGDRSSFAAAADRAIVEPEISSHHGTARFESLEAWLHTEIRGWTLADRIDDEGFRSLLDAANTELADLADGTGVAFSVSAVIASGPPRL